MTKERTAAHGPDQHRAKASRRQPPHRRLARRARRGWRPWLLFLIAALFYFYEFFARVAPGLLQDQLVEATGAAQGSLGIAMGMYFLAYGPAQLVVGRLLDRFGVRAVATPAAIVVAVGCLLFAATNNVVVMGIGRFLQGLGSSVAYLGVVYLAMVWFPPRRHGVVPGLTVAVGTLGASTAQYPLLLLAQSFGWRFPLLLCFGVGLGIALMLWIFLPVRPGWFVELMREDGFDEERPESLFDLVRNIARDRNIWLLSLAAAGLYLPISVIGDLWGVTFLQIETKATLGQASLLTTLIFLGFALGGIALGHLSDRLERRKIIFVAAAFASTALASALVLVADTPLWLTTALVALLGFATGGQTLAFVMTADAAARHDRAMNLAFVNFVIMMLPVVVQPGMGFLADIGVPSGAAPSPAQELHGYGLVMVLMLVATTLSLLVRDTRPRDEGSIASHG